MPERKDDRSLGELFAELASDTGTLVRQEVALAKTELAQNAGRVGRHVGSLAVGGAVGYAALLALMAAAIIALGQVIPLWAAALVVGVAVAVVAWWLVSGALRALKETDLVPRRTVETLKEDAQWVKNQMG